MYLERTIARRARCCSSAATRRADATEALVARSIEIKAEIVERDEREQRAAAGAELRPHHRPRDRGGDGLHAAARRSVAIGWCSRRRMAEKLRSRRAAAPRATCDARVERASGCRRRSPPAWLDRPARRADARRQEGRAPGARGSRCRATIGAMASGDGTWTVPVDESVVRAVLADVTSDGTGWSRKRGT